MADTPDLGSGAARLGGSSPLVRTNNANEVDGFENHRTGKATIKALFKSVLV
jgi:hypothetical protein